MQAFTIQPPLQDKRGQHTSRSQIVPVYPTLKAGNSAMILASSSRCFRTANSSSLILGGEGVRGREAGGTGGEGVSTCMLSREYGLRPTYP